MSGFLVLSAMMGLIALFCFLRYLGMIVHEFTHALVALAYGEKIKSITIGEGKRRVYSFFSKRFGEVIFTRDYGGLIRYESIFSYDFCGCDISGHRTTFRRLIFLPYIIFCAEQ